MFQVLADADGADVEEGDGDGEELMVKVPYPEEVDRTGGVTEPPAEADEDPGYVN